MKHRIVCFFLSGCVMTLAGCGDAVAGPATTPATRPAAMAAAEGSLASRAFTITYTAKMPADLQGPGRLDLWLPVPASDAQQTISNVRVESSLRHEFQVEAEYGNRVLHLWSDAPAGRASATLVFDCVRRQELAPPGGAQESVSVEPAASPVDRLLKPDRLGVIDDRIRALAAQITAGHTDTPARARAIYDYVIDHMAYDKVAPGWGNGDTLRACDVHKGNCTDFHALFISLARARGIPARFSIGFQLPADAQSGTIAGYHCWAEFWAPGEGWAPVDASEAWKDPKRRDFYFGNLDDNRFRLSLGRDVKLPGMKGEPLNYFLSPYAEVGGKPVKVEKSVTFGPIAEAVTQK